MGNKIGSREFITDVVDSLIGSREKLIDYVYETNKDADEYLELALLRQRERNEALRERDETQTEQKRLQGALNLSYECNRELSQERDEALREVHTWKQEAARAAGQAVRADNQRIEALHERDETKALLASETRDCQRFLHERDEARAVARWRINACLCNECDQAREKYPWLYDGRGWNPAHDEEE